MLKIKRLKQTNKQKQNLITKNGKQLVFIMIKSIQFTNETSTKKQNKKTLYRPQFGFRQAEKKNSHHKVKNHDFKTSKKRNKEILLREQ